MVYTPTHDYSANDMPFILFVKYVMYIMHIYLSHM